MSGLYTFQDAVFENESLFLDLGFFVRCTFKNCQLVYHGAGEADFEDCVFENCTWTFDQGAQRTISFLAALQHHTGSEGPELVAGIFESIRNNPVVQAGDRGQISSDEAIEIKRTLHHE